MRPLVNVAPRLELELVRQTVHLVDEHLELDVRVHLHRENNRKALQHWLAEQIDLVEARSTKVCVCVCVCMCV